MAPCKWMKMLCAPILCVCYYYFVVFSNVDHVSSPDFSLGLRSARNLWFLNGHFSVGCLWLVGGWRYIRICETFENGKWSVDDTKWPAQSSMCALVLRSCTESSSFSDRSQHSSIRTAEKKNETSQTNWLVFNEWSARVRYTPAFHNIRNAFSCAHRNEYILWLLFFRFCSRLVRVYWTGDRRPKRTTAFFCSFLHAHCSLRVTFMNLWMLATCWWLRVILAQPQPRNACDCDALSNDWKVNYFYLKKIPSHSVAS